MRDRVQGTVSAVNMSRPFSPCNTSRVQIPPPLCTGNRHTLPSISERLLAQHWRSTLARDLKTMAQKQELDSCAEGQAGKHRGCFHIPVWGGADGYGATTEASGRPVVKVMFRLLCKLMSGEHKAKRPLGGEGPDPRLLLCLRRG